MYNGKTYALTLSVITRWGTQYRLIHSLLRSKDALRRYGTRDDLDYEKSDEGKGSHSKMMESITDRNFWHDLEDLIEILKPLHDCQVMSESGDAHLGYVVKRWKTIELHLQSLRNRVGFQRSHEVDNIFLPRQTTSGRQVKPVWNMQYDKQVIDIHVMAYHLDPNNIHDAIRTDLNVINRFLAHHIPI